jgi:hypothetical protein
MREIFLQPEYGVAALEDNLMTLGEDVGEREQVAYLGSFAGEEGGGEVWGDGGVEVEGVAGGKAWRWEDDTDEERLGAEEQRALAAFKEDLCAA